MTLFRICLMATALFAALAVPVWAQEKCPCSTEPAKAPACCADGCTCPVKCDGSEKSVYVQIMLIDVDACGYAALPDCALDDASGKRQPSSLAQLTPQDSEQLSASIRTLKVRGHVEILSAPRVMALSGQQSLVAIDGGGQQLGLRLRPVVKGERVLLEFEYNVAQDVIASEQGKTPSKQIQRMAANADVRNGHTLLVHFPGYNHNGKGGADASSKSSLIALLTPQIVGNDQVNAPPGTCPLERPVAVQSSPPAPAQPVTFTAPAVPPPHVPAPAARAVPPTVPMPAPAISYQAMPVVMPSPLPMPVPVINPASLPCGIGNWSGPMPYALPATNPASFPYQLVDVVGTVTFGEKEEVPKHLMRAAKNGLELRSTSGVNGWVSEMSINLADGDRMRLSAIGNQVQIHTAQFRVTADSVSNQNERLVLEGNVRIELPAGAELTSERITIGPK